MRDSSVLRCELNFDRRVAYIAPRPLLQLAPVASGSNVTLDTIASSEPMQPALFKCEMCGECVSYTQEAVNKHIKDHLTSVGPSDDFTCAWCKTAPDALQEDKDKLWKKNMHFSRHVLQHTTLEEVSCERCGRTLSRLDSKTRHLKHCRG